MNNQNSIINRDILIANLEAKMTSTGNMKFILTDTTKNKYYFFQKNKDKTTGQPVDCDVYLSYTGMNLKIGDACSIGFTEEQKSFTNQKGENVNYTDRFILGLREANGVVVTSIQSQPKTSHNAPNNALQKESNDAFSRRLGIQGHINALLSNPEYVNNQIQLNIDGLVQFAIEIEDVAEKLINPSPFRQTVQAKAPKIVEPPVAPDIAEAAQEMEDQFSDIPF